MLRLTLDTSAIIHAAQGQWYGLQIDELADLAGHGRVGISITEAFAVDQERAPADKHQRNLEWLSRQPLISRIPGPWRLGYSGLEGPDGLLGDNGADADVTLREILLPERFQPGRLDENDPALLDLNRRKVTDVQHLTAHRMAGHDAFVTSDGRMLKKRAQLRARAGIVVVDPAEAVQLARRYVT
jgi:hypothetical protein